MKAWIYEGPYDMRLGEIPQPVPAEGEVLVKMRAVALCGSDIHGFSGKTGRRYAGQVMGHEIAGEVAELGPGVADLRVGQRVVIQPIIYCGECETCRAGKTNICLRKRLIGVNTDTMGGYSEYLAVPRRNVLPISDSVAYTTAALVEPFAVGGGAVRSAGIAEGEDVAIVGAGVIGQTILLMAREQGPKRIFVVDNNRRKLDVAEELGAIPVDFSECDPLQAIQEQTGGLGVDVSFEAVGLTPSVQTATYAAKPGGRVVWVGNSQRMVEVDMQDVVVKAKCIQGVYCYTDDDFAKAVSFVERNRDVAGQFAEEEVAFEEMPVLMTRLAKGEIELFRGVCVF